MALSHDANSFNLIIVFIISALGLLAGYAIKEISNRLPTALAAEWICQANDILGVNSGISDLVQVRKETRLRTCIFLVATTILSIVTFHRFGFAIESVLLLLFTWSITILSIIDVRHHLLPDIIIYPLLWSGLIANSFELFSTLSDGLWGVVCGYGSFWLILMLFKVVTKQDGMGLGDVKMLAMLGAWTGWKLLPLTILIASAVGAATAIGLRLINNDRPKSPIPFGPYLAIGGWIALLWGNDILY